MSTLKDLNVASNVSEAIQVKEPVVVFRVVTSASASVTIQRSIDNGSGTFVDITDTATTVNGTDEIQLADCKPGQYLRVSADANLTSVKALF